MLAVGRLTIERLDEVLVLWRADLRRHLAALACFAINSIAFTGWKIALAWLLVAVVARAGLGPGLDWVASRGVSERVRFWVSVAALAGHHLVAATIGIAMAVNGGPWGVGFGLTFLMGFALYGTIASRRSKMAFWASLIPYMAAMATLPFLAAAGGASVWIAGSFALGIAVFCINFVDFQRAAAQAIEKLEEAKTEAEAATAAKSSFVAMVSHELRTPISGILAGASELDKVLVDKAGRSHARLIEDSGRMMRTLLNDLLDMSKIEAGRMATEAIPFDLRRMVGDAVRFWAPEARVKGLRFRLQGAHALPTWAEGDPTRIRQIINNLVSNALKFTDTGSITLKLETVHTGDQAFDLNLEVIDSGPGMDAEQTGRLFAAFDQLSSGTARRHGGTGLGLYISRQLAELMNGSLGVRSMKGVGTTFRLAVPLRRAAAPALVGPALAPPTAVGLRVLIADDHAVNRAAFSLVLEPFCESVTTVEDGEEALEVLAASAFDVVLLDLNMPRLGGLETARQLRARPGPNQHTVVMALTASASVKDVEACLDAGMDAFVTKPLEASELLAAIEHALDHKGEALDPVSLDRAS